LEHNLAWFNRHIFGDPKPDLSAPVVPASQEKGGDKTETKANTAQRIPYQPHDFSL